MNRLLILVIFSLMVSGCSVLTPSTPKYGTKINERDLIAFSYHNSEDKKQYASDLSKVLYQSLDFQDDIFLGKTEEEIIELLTLEVDKYLNTLPLLNFVTKNEDGSLSHTLHYDILASISKAKYDHDKQALILKYKNNGLKLALNTNLYGTITSDWPLRTKVSRGHILKAIEAELYFDTSEFEMKMSAEDALNMVKRAKDPKRRISRVKKMVVVEGKSSYYTYYYDRLDIRILVNSLNCNSFSKNSKFVVSCNAISEPVEAYSVRKG